MYLALFRKRLELILVTRGRSVVVALLLLSVVTAGISIGAYWDEQQPPERQSQFSETVTASLETSAVVTGESRLYEQGERLRNEPVYLQQAAPDLTVTVQTTVPRAADVQQRLVLVWAAERDGKTFWTRTRTLDTTTVKKTETPVESSATLSLADVRKARQRLSDELGGAGQVRASVRTVIDYRTEEYAGTLTSVTPIGLETNAYVVRPRQRERTHEILQSRPPVTDRWQVVDLKGPLPVRTQVSGGVALGGLVAAGIVVRHHRQNADEQQLRNAISVLRYGEWISVATIPDDFGEHYVRTDTLEDLVNVGIDTNKRVIRDPETEQYAVKDGSVVYHYSAVETNSTDWVWTADEDSEME